MEEATPKDDKGRARNRSGSKIAYFETTSFMNGPFYDCLCMRRLQASRKIQLELKLSRTCCEELLVQTFKSVVCTSSETSKLIKPVNLDSKHDVVIYFGKGLWFIIQGFTYLLKW